MKKSCPGRLEEAMAAQSLGTMPMCRNEQRVVFVVARRDLRCSKLPQEREYRNFLRETLLLPETCLERGLRRTMKVGTKARDNNV